MKITASLTFLLSYVACAAGAERQKGEMGSSSVGSDADAEYERYLKQTDDRYPYKHHYVTIVKPEDAIFNFKDGGAMSDNFADMAANGFAMYVMGMTFTESGRVYDPADIQMVNKFHGVTRDDPFPPGLTWDSIPDVVHDVQGKLRYAGNRQPKSPIPAGDAAYFFHGQCSPNSGTSEDLMNVGPNFLVITSQTCLFNLCLGGGGFDCIAILAGSAYYDNMSDRISNTHAAFMNQQDMDKQHEVGNDLPPPIRATIIGGTGSFEGIEGTVDIATIAGSAGYVFHNTGGNPMTERYDIGYKVQTITVTSNTPLPTAP